MLTMEGCRARQKRFLDVMDEHGVAAVAITAPRDIYYLTGLVVENRVYGNPSLLVLGPGLPTWLGTWREDGDALVEQREVYQADVMSTTNWDNHHRLAALLPAIGGRLRGKVPALGYQGEGGAKLVLDALGNALGSPTWQPIDDCLQQLQLRKDPDEVECLKLAGRVNEAAYRRAAEVIAPGMTEVELLGECHRAALESTGHPIYFGGDCRSDAPGGPARAHRLEAGEILILDVQTDPAGYWSDLSRAFVVGGKATDEQMEVHEHLRTILEDVPAMVRPGLSCLEFWKELDARIREHKLLAKTGLIHHGGHGIGLRAHEQPDISAERDATFEVGNTFTVEPGAYLPNLRAGIRVENNYFLTERGLELLGNPPYAFEKSA